MRKQTTDRPIDTACQQTEPRAVQYLHDTVPKSVQVGHRFCHGQSYIEFFFYCVWISWLEFILIVEFVLFDQSFSFDNNFLDLVWHWLS